MAIDLNGEQGVTITFARRELIPHLNDKPISPATARRWIDRGVLARDGTRVRLEAVRVGRTFVTTPSCVRSFLDELARRSGVEPRSDTELDTETVAELSAHGLLPTMQRPPDRL